VESVLDYTNKITKKVEKVALLFNDEKIVTEILNQLKNSDYMVRRINRNKPIVDNFKTLNVQYFNINKDRKLSYDCFRYNKNRAFRNLKNPA